MGCGSIPFFYYIYGCLIKMLILQNNRNKRKGLKLMRRLIIWIFFVFVSLTTAAQWNTRNILQMGKSAIYFDDYVSAIENFNNIIRIKPYLAEPYFFRGLAKLNLDDYDGAINDYSSAIDLNPNYFLAYMYRGVAYNSLKKYEEALADYDYAVSLSPGDAYIYAYRGATKSETGDFKGAEKDYSKALLLDNKLLFAYLNRAIMRERLDDTEGAMADCNAALQLNMFSDDAYGLRGYLFFRKKQYHEAIEDYNRAFKANPKNKKVLMSRALVWYEMKKYQETLNDYTEAIKIDSNYIYAYYNRALLRAEVGDYNNAITDLDHVVDMNPDNILVYYNRGLLKMQVGDQDGAYDDFTECLRLYPDFVNAYLGRAAISMDRKDYDLADRDRYNADRIIERYRKMKEGDANALVDTSANFQRLIDINAKDDAMRDVVNGRVQDKNVIIELQNVFSAQYLSIDTLRSGKVLYFNKHIMDFNLKHNYNPAIGFVNKRIPYTEDFTREFMDQLSVQITKNGDADSYLLRGGLYLNRQEFPKAINDFKAITDKNPANILALFNLATARMLMYDYIESLDDQTPRIIGEDKEVQRKVDYSQILADYNECLRLDPTFVFALFNIADVYTKSEEIDKAIETYTRVIAMDKEIAEAYFNRGLLYIYKGNKLDANIDLSKAGELGITDAYNIIKRYCKDE